METDAKKNWDAYVANTLETLRPGLAGLGYALDDTQPHTIGERFLTRPLGAGRKLVLLGTRAKDGLRVVIKASDEKYGIAELEEERDRRTILKQIKFAYQAFRTPNELLFRNNLSGFTISITEYVEQEQSFIERPLKEQFTLVLSALKAQEAAHATTHEHLALVRKTFGEMRGADYFDKIQRYAQDTIGLLDCNDPSYAAFDRATDTAIRMLHNHQDTLEQYGGFLTHWDFTPQNFRIRGGEFYMLDNASLRFGNKYESWARFVNFMTLYNPRLADALVEYVRLNRAPEELLSLKLMRVFRLVELIRYYTTWLGKTRGDTQKLADARIAFWTEVLEAVLADREVSAETVGEYKKTRDALRSADEKKRQVGLH